MQHWHSGVVMELQYSFVGERTHFYKIGDVLDVHGEIHNVA